MKFNILTALFLIHLLLNANDNIIASEVLNDSISSKKKPNKEETEILSDSISSQHQPSKEETITFINTYADSLLKIADMHYSVSNEGILVINYHKKDTSNNTNIIIPLKDIAISTFDSTFLIHRFERYSYPITTLGYVTTIQLERDGKKLDNTHTFYLKGIDKTELESVYKAIMRLAAIFGAQAKTKIRRDLFNNAKN